MEPSKSLGITAWNHERKSEQREFNQLLGLGNTTAGPSPCIGEVGAVAAATTSNAKKMYLPFYISLAILTLFNFTHYITAEAKRLLTVSIVEIPSSHITDLKLAVFTNISSYQDQKASQNVADGHPMMLIDNSKTSMTSKAVVVNRKIISLTLQPNLS